MPGYQLSEMEVLCLQMCFLSLVSLASQLPILSHFITPTSTETEMRVTVRDGDTLSTDVFSFFILSGQLASNAITFFTPTSTEIEKRVTVRDGDTLSTDVFLSLVSLAS